MDETMTQVLVVGGAGYIGSHACKALAEAQNLLSREALASRAIDALPEVARRMARCVASNREVARRVAELMAGS